LVTISILLCIGGDESIGVKKNTIAFQKSYLICDMQLHNFFKK